MYKAYKKHIVILAAIILIGFCLIFSVSCRELLPFDTTLTGHYELLNTKETPVSMTVLQNGRFCDSKGTGWIEIPKEHCLRFIYDNGRVDEVTYSKRSPAMVVMSSDGFEMEYVNTVTFSEGHDEHSIVGQYMNDKLTISIVFEKDGNGRFIYLSSGEVINFSYSANHGILRLLYSDPPHRGYEYFSYSYEKDDLNLKSYHNDEEFTFYHSVEGINCKSFVIIEGNKDTSITSLQLKTKSCFLNSERCNTVWFANNQLLIYKEDKYIPLIAENHAPWLELQLHGKVYYLLDKRAFNKDAVMLLQGIYVSEDLHTIMILNEDGSGHLTMDNRGFDFDAHMYEDILRCVDHSIGCAIYYRVTQTSTGISILPLPTCKDEKISGMTLIKIR